MTSGFSAAISPLISGRRSLQRLWSCSRLSVATRNCIGLPPQLVADCARPGYPASRSHYLGGGGWSASALRLLRQEMLHDLPAGGAPDAGMRADVIERRIERA